MYPALQPCALTAICPAVWPIPSNTASFCVHQVKVKDRQPSFSSFHNRQGKKQYINFMQNIQYVHIIRTLCWYKLIPCMFAFEKICQFAKAFFLTKLNLMSLFTKVCTDTLAHEKCTCWIFILLVSNYCVWHITVYFLLKCWCAA